MDSRWILMAIGALALAGCEDKTPPHWADVCVKDQLMTTMITVWNGTSVTVQPLFYSVCTKTERRCVRGKDYQGGGTCND